MEAIAIHIVSNAMVLPAHALAWNELFIRLPLEHRLNQLTVDRSQRHRYQQGQVGLDFPSNALA